MVATSSARVTGENSTLSYGAEYQCWFLSHQQSHRWSVFAVLRLLQLFRRPRTDGLLVILRQKSKFAPHDAPWINTSQRFTSIGCAARFERGLKVMSLPWDHSTTAPFQGTCSALSCQERKWRTTSCCELHTCSDRCAMKDFCNSIFP